MTGAAPKPVSTTILVIDDDPDVLWSTAKIIRDAGFVVLEGASADDAIKLTTQYHPALVLLDVALPDGDGIDIALRIKKDPTLSSVFVVLCSGTRISPRDQVEGLNRGHADGYIIRPVGKDELVARIDAFLRIRAGLEALRESEEKYRSILKASPDDITITDLEGNISMVSPAALTILGFKHESDLVGHSIAEFIAPDDRDRATATIALMHQGVFSGPGEYHAIRADGSIFDIEVNAEFIRDGNGQPSGMVFIVRDITGRKLAEESLKESNQKLRFLTGLTRHDILNQLSAIQLLQDLALHSSDLTKIKEYLLKSQEVGNHIEATIGFTRDYEGFGTISSGWQKIGPIIESAKSEVSLGNVRVHNHISKDLEVYADPIIRKVFTTLLDNAVRHGKNVTNISFSYSEFENTLVIICDDDGGGVPIGEKEYIFDHGYGKNTGVGLFLAREILSITGLSIRECGVPGEGARFEILVPAGRFCFLNPDTNPINENQEIQKDDVPLGFMLPTNTEEQRTIISDQIASGHGISLLYIDDDPLLRLAGKEYLVQRYGFEVTTAESAAEALHLLTETSFDTIISDYDMPKMTGLALLKQLKAAEDTTPFIILTGINRENVVIEALNSGADFYLQKGGDPKVLFADLENKIRFAVSRRRTEQDLLRKSKELHDAYEEISAIEEELRSNLDELTRQEQLVRESEVRLRTILHSMQFGIIIIDAQTHIILEVNQKAIDMVGAPADVISGSICHTFICPAELGRCPITDLGQTVNPSDRVLLTARGERIPVLKTVVKTTLGGREVLIESFVDITERKNAEEALAESEKHYRDLFESSDDAIMTLEPPSWKFTTCNQAAIELFGAASKEEFCSFGQWDISPKTQPDGLDSLCKAKDMIQMALCKGSHFFEWNYTHINGKEFPTTVLLTRMNRYGIEYLQATIRDITEQKETEDKINQIIQRLTMAAEAAHFGVWDLNLINNHLEWDDWMLYLYGINREDFTYTYDAWQQRIHPDDLDRVRKEVDLALHGEKPFDTEFRIVRPDGEIRYLKANAIISIDRYLCPIRMTGINYDITDRKQYEWEITQYAEQLGAQNLSLEELSDELTQLNLELDEKVRERTEEISHLLTVKTDLITQIGHDLKTPLTSLIALLPYINKKVTDPDLRELLDIVILDSNRMNQIINNILTLTTIDTQIPEALIGRSPVADIVNRVISAEHLFIGQINLHIVNLVSSSFVIRMNEAHGDLLFSNLISNAVKYSRVDGTIRIDTEISHDTFFLIVQDDGQGIAPEHLHRIFEEFFKVDSSRHDRDSYGLGLTLVQRIVKSYGGTITAESEGIGKGTTIRICFPVGMMIHNPE